MITTVDPLYSFKCGIASFLANYAVGFLHPLELLKTRLQSHDGKKHHNLVPQYNGIISGIKSIYKNEGLNGLFKGIHMTTFTSALASSLFFWIYQNRKLYYQIRNNPIMSATGMASLEASILTTLLTQPFWVIKTRVLLNTSNASQMQSMVLKSKQIYRQYGFKGFYLGLFMNLVLSLTGALQMYAYEGSKLLFQNLAPGSSEGVKSFICGGISKLLSTVITYPLTTIRTRVQQDQYIEGLRESKYKGNIDVVKNILMSEGFKGFFKGLATNLIRGIPHRGVYFYFYELFKKAIITKEPYFF